MSKINLGSYKGYTRGLYTRENSAQTMLCRTVITVGKESRKLLEI